MDHISELFSMTQQFLHILYKSHSSLTFYSKRTVIFCLLDQSSTDWLQCSKSVLMFSEPATVALCHILSKTCQPNSSRRILLPHTDLKNDGKLDYLALTSHLDYWVVFCNNVIVYNLKELLGQNLYIVLCLMQSLTHMK